MVSDLRCWLDLGAVQQAADLLIVLRQYLSEYPEARLMRHSGGQKDLSALTPIRHWLGRTRPDGVTAPNWCWRANGWRSPSGEKAGLGRGRLITRVARVSSGQMRKERGDGKFPTSKA
jgi:hypothetical protein